MTQSIGNGPDRQRDATFRSGSNGGIVLSLKAAFVSALGLLSLACSSDDLQLPGCLSDLLASCPTAGTCSFSSSATGEPPEVCFASGVHAAFSSMDAPDACNVGVHIVTVTTAAGTPCYSMESFVDSGMVCEGVRYTWKDASGQVVATAVENGFSTPRLVVTCASSGEKRSCGRATVEGPTDGCCRISDLGAASCTPPVGSGTCSPGDCAPVN